MANRKDYHVDLPGVMTWVQSGSTTTQHPTIHDRVADRVATDYLRRPKPSGWNQTYGWVAPTPYSMLTYTYRAPNGTLRYYPSNAPNTGPRLSGSLISQDCALTVGGFSPIQSSINAKVPSVIPSDLANRTLMRARSKLQDGTLNLAQAYAERRQVSNLLLSTAKTLADSFSYLRKGKFKKAAKRLGIKGAVRSGAKGLSGQWLALQYGWKPLLSDIHGACLTLDKLDRSAWRVTVVSRIKSVTDVSYVYGTENKGTFTALYSDVTAHGRYGCHIRIDAMPNASAICSMASVGVTNPAVLAWELLPYSFVVDWLLPVGDYLAQFDALAGWDILGYTESSLARVNYKVVGKSGSGTDFNGITWTLSSNWVGEGKSVRLDRVARTSVPFPVFPKMKDPRSRLHIANALALVTQVFLKGKSTVK